MDDKKIELTQKSITLSDSSSELKSLFKDFLSCKNSTLEAMNNLEKVKSVEDIKQIVVAQKSCINTLKTLNSKYSEKLIRYEKAMEATGNRINSESFLLQKTLDGDTGMLSVGFFTLQGVRVNEQKLWQGIEENGKSQKDPEAFHPSFFLVSGWSFFLFVGFLLLKKGKDSSKPLPFSSEKVKLYFDDERTKYANFLIKIFKKDKNDKK